MWMRSSTPNLYNTMKEKSPRKTARSCFPWYLHGHQSSPWPFHSNFACSRPTTGLELPSQLLGASALVHTQWTSETSHVLSRDLLAQSVAATTHRCDVRKQCCALQHGVCINVITHLPTTVNDAILLFFGTLTSGLTHSTSISKTHTPPSYRSHIWKHSMLVHHYPRWARLTRLREIASRAPAPPAMPPERHQHPRLDPSTPQEHPHLAATPDQWLAREPVHACTCLCFAR